MLAQALSGKEKETNQNKRGKEKRQANLSVASQAPNEKQKKTVRRTKGLFHKQVRIVRSAFVCGGPAEAVKIKGQYTEATLSHWLEQLMVPAQNSRSSATAKKKEATVKTTKR